MTAPSRRGARSEQPLVAGADAAVVAGQLGRAPHAMSAVAARCPVRASRPSSRTCPTTASAGRSRRCTTAPARRWSPPCPGWRATAAWRAWTRRVAAEPELARARRRTPPPTPPSAATDLVRDHGLTMVDGGASLSTGVGGVSDLLAVKCLHAHVAHALARPGLRAGRGDPRARSPTPGATTAAAPPCSPGRRGGPGVKVAIVDLGTNTCRLFLADVTDGRVAQDARVTTVVRLGQGVDETGRLHEDAVERTHACLEGYAPRLEDYGPERRLLDRHQRPARRQRRQAVPQGDAVRVRACRGGSSAGRRRGRSRFAAGPRGCRRRGWDGPAAGRRPPARCCSSTSAAAAPSSPSASAGEPPAFVRSLDVGVVRLTERFFHADPPPAAEVAALSGHVAAAIEAAVPAELRAAVRGAVGVAGTYTTLVANKLGMTEYDGAARPGPRALARRHRRGRSPASPRSPAPSAAGCRASSPAARTSSSPAP